MITLELDQIVDAIRNDIINKIEQGVFVGLKETRNESEYNVQGMVRSYSQWTENEVELEDSVMRLYSQEFRDK